MSKNHLIILALIFISSCAEKAKSNYNFTTVFETSNGTETATYEQIINYYKHLATVYPQINIEAIGETDSGKPLHIITLNNESLFDFENIRKNNRIILINNGIHPGESDGIDATMMLYRDIVQNKIKTPKNTTLVTIPVYNIGGCLNRNSYTRTNQNGPKSYGFRGNARNFDLNRDFIKNDTKNAKTFAEIFHKVKPDVFIDNHVSNGADYQYTLTHLFTQHNKLGGDLGNYLHTKMVPKLEKHLSKANWDITPYVNVFNTTPEKGFSQFMDTPRYSTGYTALFNTLGIMVETHMLKPYKQRVEGTYELMKKMIDITEQDGKEIRTIRNKAIEEFYSKNTYTIDWEVNYNKSTTLNFKGYEGNNITSKITGLKRLKYDQKKPYIKEINYNNYFKPKTEITIPKSYIIPLGLHPIIKLLKLNHVILKPLSNDSIITVESYKIKSYDSRKTPYEGHYLHYNTKINSTIEQIQFRKGDFLLDTNQPSFRYIIETLEPEAPDSFFNWNFFDTILQQKEGFSPYVWEDNALNLLNIDTALKSKFEVKKSSDSNFSKNWYAQLDWLHKNSKHYEKAHLQYPIYRIIKIEP